MNCLVIWFENQRVGELRDVGNARFMFRYDKTWLADQKAFALSISLPLMDVIFKDRVCHAYFANLLPEGPQRTLLAKQQGISVQNDFKLLQAIGGECAGAIGLLSPGVLPGERRSGHYELIESDDLDALVDRFVKHPMLAGDGDLRLSLAGAQEKLPIYYHNGKVYLPHGELPSSHIIKPSCNPHYPDVYLNEHFCMTLAQQVGLQAANSFVIEGGLFCCERYDRQYQHGQIVRLHQEDFCQAMNCYPSTKYQSEGGPSLKQGSELIRRYSSQPAGDLNQLLLWSIFNFLIGNADAHGKNISFIVDPYTRTRKLAPFYDLLSTAIYSELSKKMAMKIGGEYRPDRLRQEHWKIFCEEIEISWKLFQKQAKSLITQMKSTFLAKDHHVSAMEIFQVFQARSKQLQKALLD